MFTYRLQWADGSDAGRAQSLRHLQQALEEGLSAAAMASFELDPLASCLDSGRWNRPLGTGIQVRDSLEDWELRPKGFCLGDRHGGRSYPGPGALPDPGAPESA